VETRIKLDRFVFRNYQKPVLDAIENAGYKKVLLNWSRRCLSGDSHILMANGSYKPLRSIKRGDLILSWDGTSVVQDKVKSVWKTGVKPTKKIKAFINPPMITSCDHVLANTCVSSKIVHWDRATDIQKRRRLVSYVGHNNGTVSEPDMAEFIGYLTCDGYVVGYQQPKFTNTNVEILKRVESLALSLFGCTAI